MNGDPEGRAFFGARILRIRWQLHKFVLPQFVDTQVPRNAEQPSPKCAICAQFSSSPNDPQKSFCCRVFRIRAVAEHSEGVAENPLTIQLVYSTKRVGIALGEGGEPALLGQ